MLRDKQHGRVAIPHLYECYKIEFQGWMSAVNTLSSGCQNTKTDLWVFQTYFNVCSGALKVCVVRFFFRRFQRKKRLNMPRNLYQLIENSIIFALRFWVIPPMSWQWNGSTRIKFIDPRQLHWWPSEGMPWISNIFSKICHQRWMRIYCDVWGDVIALYKGWWWKGDEDKIRILF